MTKKVLILGIGGMIGHQMYRRLILDNYEILGTFKQPFKNYEKFNLFRRDQIKDNFDVSNFDRVQDLLSQFQPDVILNCIGITLRKPEIKNEIYCQKINSEFPHFLNKWCEVNKSYLIHFSTDCVFSGKSGPYTEQSVPDATDIYGLTKSKGEVTGNFALTLRGSMIGRELFGKSELLEWAISQKNLHVKGYTQALYSGVTTNVMSDLVAKLINLEVKKVGLYQVSSQAISKYDLLALINQYFKLNLVIEKYDQYSTQKILISQKLSKEGAFDCPDWPAMIQKLSIDLFRYDS